MSTLTQIKIKAPEMPSSFHSRLTGTPILHPECPDAGQRRELC
jgi:hypothetical protein